MSGAMRVVGAVACLRRVLNPVRAALAVLEHTPHVLLVGAGADAFARARGLAAADSAWLVVPAQRERLRRARRRASATAPAHGTVGAVARDARGHLAAATSTGGIVGQRPGRGGASPLAGAGTWADDTPCAVSATGPGEALIRSAFAHEVDAAMRLAGLGLGSAVASAFERLAALGAAGGCIALARAGPAV